MRIRPTSSALIRWVVGLSLILVSVPPIWMWLDPTSFMQWGGDDIVARFGGFERLVFWQRLAGFVITAIPQALLIWALTLIWRLTRLVDAGRWFDAISESLWRRAGIIMLWYALAGWLSQTLLVLVMTALDGPGNHMLVISFESNDVIGLIPALMALVIARMVALARAQRDELDEIV